MARRIPRTGPWGDDRSEQRVLHFLEGVFAGRDDVTIWCKPVLPDEVEPDIVLFGPDFGLCVVEVKGWSAPAIREADGRSFVIGKVRGTETHKNPERQAKGYADALRDALRTRSELVAKSGEHQGQPILPIGRLVAFPNIARASYGFERALPSKYVLLRDDLDLSYPSVAARRLVVQIRETQPFPPRPLADRELRALDETVWSSVRSIRRAGRTPRALRDEIHRLDHDQQRIARGLGRGHRFVRGPSGSGKTLVLVHRAVHLLRHAASVDRVLFVCFNIALASHVRRLIQEQGLGIEDGHMEVRHVFELAQDLLGEPVTFAGRKAEYYDDVLARAVAAAGKDGAPRYDAVMVDEGQDLSDAMIRLVVSVLRPDGDLLIAEDSSQNLYRRTSSWKDLGVNATKKARVLRHTYRSTEELQTFTRPWEAAERRKEPPGLPLTAPEGMHGPPPRLEQHAGLAELLTALAADIERRVHDLEYSRAEIGIVYEDKLFDADGFEYADRDLPRRIVQVLEQHAIPARWASEDVRSKELFDVTGDRVQVISVHSAKGIDFDLVYALGLDALPWTKDTVDQTRANVYVAITRARHALVIPYIRESPVIRELTKGAGSG